MEDVVAFWMERYHEVLCGVQPCRVLDVLMSSWCEKGMVTDFTVDLIYDGTGKVMDYRMGKDDKYDLN